MYHIHVHIYNVYSHIHTYTYITCIDTYTLTHTYIYRVATTSRLLKITGLFCKRALYKRQYSAKETYDFKEPTNRRHTISPKYKWPELVLGNKID